MVSGMGMKQIFTILFFLLAIVAQAQRQQISYIEETKNWYYVYDERGKRIGGLSRSSVGEQKGWGSDFFGRERTEVEHRSKVLGCRF